MLATRILITILLLTITAPAAGVAAQSAELPTLTQPVNDFAHVVDAESAGEMDRLIRALQATTGDVVVVATVPTIEPYGDIDGYAVKLFENHGRGIGAKGKDNGLLIVVALKERLVRIEVGYDLEQWITDGFAGETRREFIAPLFRQGQYGAGLLAGVRRIIGRIAEGRGVTLQGAPPPRPVRPTGGVPVWLIILLIIFFMLLGRTGRRGRRVRYWGGGPWSGWSSGVGPFGGGWSSGGGGFGGGFGGFGGGRSGGGGSSGSW